MRRQGSYLAAVLLGVLVLNQAPRALGQEPQAQATQEPQGEPAVQVDHAERFPDPPVTRQRPLVEVGWKPHWGRANWWDAAAIGTFGALFLLEDALPPERTADWSSPILWDRAVRNALRLEVPEDRIDIASVSDAMMFGSMIHNLIFDNLVIAALVHGDPDVAFQLTVMNLEAYAIALSVTALVKRATGRARPYVESCEQDPLYDPSCNSPGDFRSFFSGHASTTAVGAGLLCAHHTNMPLYDNGPLDVGACALGVVLTLVTGGLRIASDKHWATDVTMGHLVGFASGYLVPTLLYYRAGDDPEPLTGSAMLLPSVGRDSLGLQVTGRM